MGAKSISPPLRQDPPEKLVKRSARVGIDVTNTIRVPHDRFRDDTSAWFLTASMPAVLAGNQVKYYIDGRDAFPEMVAAMRTAVQPNHFIYMVNWFCDVDFHLLDDEPGVNLRQILTEASDHKVMIRAMLWKHAAPVSQNVEAVRFLNSLETRVTAQGPILVPSKNPLFNSAALHDARGNDFLPLPIVSIFPKHVGTQHQKILCVFGDRGLISFVGGIDFNSDRIFTKAADEGSAEVETGQPLHDVHCRIIGPAAMELVNLFRDKWNDSDFGQKANAKKGPLIIPGQQSKSGDHVVQVTRTLSRDSYKFAPKGERTLAAMIGHAIRNAKRYIYTEDQYFVGGNAELEGALIQALGRIEHLTAVITHWEISDLVAVNLHRARFIKKLKDAGGDKVRIFTLQPNGNTRNFQDGKEKHTYVHAKIWIIDDEFVSIGTPNSNRRGWSKDNEVTAGIYETSTDAVLRYRLPHWLRIELWKEHLNMNTVEANAELADGVASAAHWLKLPAGARVRPYRIDEKNHDGQNDVTIPIPIIGIVGNSDAVWDTFLDPE